MMSRKRTRSLSEDCRVDLLSPALCACSSRVCLREIDDESRQLACRRVEASRNEHLDERDRHAAIVNWALFAPPNTCRSSEPTHAVVILADTGRRLLVSASFVEPFASFLERLAATSGFSPATHRVFCCGKEVDVRVNTWKCFGEIAAHRPLVLFLKKPI